MPVPQHEHEKRDQLIEDVFYLDHEHPRAETSTFRHTKEQGHKAGLRCAISGQKDSVEYHHVWCEYSLADAVDWATVKRIGTGELKELPVLHPVTDQPTEETYPVEQSLIWAICKIAELRGFDWQKFDPAKPETFVDSMANMLVLAKKFHRGRDHGIHNMTFPEYVFQAFPRITGFVYTPDEVQS